MRPSNCYWLRVVEIKDLYVNAIHSAMECNPISVSGEGARQSKMDFGALEGERNLLLEEGQWLKARVNQVKGTTKETFESIGQALSKLG